MWSSFYSKIVSEEYFWVRKCALSQLYSHLAYNSPTKRNSKLGKLAGYGHILPYLTTQNFFIKSKVLNPLYIRLADEIHCIVDQKAGNKIMVPKRKFQIYYHNFW